jgi:hypothetical protein
MNDCATCGQSVRLGTMRVSMSRKRGVAHWIELADGTQCVCLKEYCWTKWRADKRRPSISEQKIAEWNSANTPVSSGQREGGP